MGNLVTIFYYLITITATSITVPTIVVTSSSCIFVGPCPEREALNLPETQKTSCEKGLAFRVYPVYPKPEALPNPEPSSYITLGRLETSHRHAHHIPPGGFGV